MKNKPTKLLFITPYGGLSGSEMMLWYLIKDLNTQELDCRIFSCQYGELVKNSDHFVYHHEIKPDLFYRLKNKLCRLIFGISLQERYLLKVHRKFKPDYWYLNTCIQPWAAKLAIKRSIPYIVHFHELPSVYERIPLNDWKEMLFNSKINIACSSKVYDAINSFNFSPKNKILFSFINTDRVIYSKSKEIIRKELNIPENSFIWLMSGLANYRKGVDLLPEIACKLPENTYILWLGNFPENGLTGYVREAIRRNPKVKFISLGEKKDDYYDFLNVCDGFVLTSREDPFPLVMIEAAYLEKPIFSFNSGGVKEFVQNGMGIVIENIDPNALGEQMSHYQLSKQNIFRNDIMKNRALQYNINSQIKNWKNLIYDFISQESI